MIVSPPLPPRAPYERVQRAPVDTVARDGEGYEGLAVSVALALAWQHAAEEGRSQGEERRKRRGGLRARGGLGHLRPLLTGSSATNISSSSGWWSHAKK